jgi:glutaminyl-peptide cyclotransferase
MAAKRSRSNRQNRPVAPLRRGLPWLAAGVLILGASAIGLLRGPVFPRATLAPPGPVVTARTGSPLFELREMDLPKAIPPFDKARAFRDLELQVEFGPRVPGMPGHTATRDHLMKEFGALADRVERQDLTHRVRGKTLYMSNIIARWNGAGAGEPVLLAAHWDTRPTADEETDPARRAMPIPGANDGASGVAVLLEIARGLKRMPPPGPVMIVLFDGEDYGPTSRDMFLGSRYFARNLPRDVPRRGILLDMVGDADLKIPIEGHSWDNARSVVVEVYTIAAKLGYDEHFPRRLGRHISDDHVPLQERGLEVIDLIDFHYGRGHIYWHTLEDTPDKCSPESLGIVGDVVLNWVFSR